MAGAAFSGVHQVACRCVSPDSKLDSAGATPGGIIVNVKQLRARVEEIDHAARTVVLIGPQGKRVTVTVDERVERFGEFQPGDIVVVRYTESLAMKMIKE